MKDVQRIDIIWDTYKQDSLKGMTREKRGEGARRRVSEMARVPSNWQEFLRNDLNKTELFKLLAEVSTNTCSDKVIISTCEENVLCNQACENLDVLAPCTHEEADTRIFLHAKDAALKGFKKIRTVDTGVIVVAISITETIRLEEIWIHFGVGKNTRFIPIHEIFKTLGPSKSVVLPLFHALTDCDQTSSFSGRSKKTCWSVWKSFDELTEWFLKIQNDPNALLDSIATIEQFVVLIYDKTSSCMTVNEARK